MVRNRQWVVLPYLLAKELPGLSMILQGVKEDRDWRPWWLGYYSYSNLNSETLPIVVLSVMQYGRSLDRLIREVFIADLALGPMHILRADASDGF